MAHEGPYKKGRGLGRGGRGKRLARGHARKLGLGYRFPGRKPEDFEPIKMKEAKKPGRPAHEKKTRPEAAAAAPSEPQFATPPSAPGPAVPTSSTTTPTVSRRLQSLSEFPRRRMTRSRARQ